MLSPWEYKTLESFDKTSLFVRFVKRENARAVLLIVHGHGEHSGRYFKFQKELEALPLSIVAFDLRGNGKSEGKKVYVDTFNDYLNDLSFVVEDTRKSFPGLPIFLLGHSLGGLISVSWVIQRKPVLGSLILSSPCLGLNLPAPLVAFNSLLQRYFPAFCYQNPVYPPHLSHNPEEIKQYKADTLIQRKITTRLIFEMIRMSKWLRDQRSIKIDCPLLLITGSLEKVVRGEDSELFYKKIEAPRKEHKNFEGFYHEVFNELDQEKTFEVLRDFLSSLVV